MTTTRRTRRAESGVSQEKKTETSKRRAITEQTLETLEEPSKVRKTGKRAKHIQDISSEVEKENDVYKAETTKCPATRRKQTLETSEEPKKARKGRNGGKVMQDISLEAGMENEMNSHEDPCPKAANEHDDSKKLVNKKEDSFENSKATRTKKAARSNSVVTCQVCIEECNQSSRKVCICQKCQYACCRDCFCKYILTQIDDAHCMNCREPIPRPQLAELVTKKFLTDEYREHRKDIIIERERARLPETHPIFLSKVEEATLRKALAEVRGQLIKLKERKRRLENRLGNVVEVNEKCDSEGVTLKNVSDLPQVLGPCPKNGCAGYISNGWKCRICDSKVCSKCKEQLPDHNEQEEPGKKHVCNDDIVKSLALIKKDSKNCPKCKVLVYKVHGCNQMWCTQCNTAFCWATLRILNDVRYFHNPHFAEWQQSRATLAKWNRNSSEENLDRCIDFGSISQMLQIIYPQELKKATGSVTPLRLILLRINEINDSTIVESEEKHRNALLGIRIKYAQGQYTESAFRSRLESRERVRARDQEHEMILQTIANCIRDVMTSLYVDVCARKTSTSAEKRKLAANFLKQVDTLLDQGTENLREVSKWYGMTTTERRESILGPEWDTKTFHNNLTIRDDPILIFAAEELTKRQLDILLNQL